MFDQIFKTFQSEMTKVKDELRADLRDDVATRVEAAIPQIAQVARDAVKDQIDVAVQDAMQSAVVAQIAQAVQDAMSAVIPRLEKIVQDAVQQTAVVAHIESPTVIRMTVASNSPQEAVHDAVLQVAGRIMQQLDEELKGRR